MHEDNLFIFLSLLILYLLQNIVKIVYLYSHIKEVYHFLDL